MASALAEKKLSEIGVKIISIPDHRKDTTLNEDDLAKRLANRPDGDHDPRVRHDVDCIAGVLTIRRGRTSETIDSAKAIFATSSSLTVKNAREWYESEGGMGVSPIVHYLELSNLAWIKCPSSASSLKLHELVALCGAALRPSRKAWDSFLNHLQSLQKSGELSSDEVTALVVSALVDRELADATMDDDCDAECLGEVVERVMASYRNDADIRVAEALEKVQEANERAEATKVEIEANALAELIAAREDKAKAVRSAQEIRLALEKQAGIIAKVVCLVPCVIITALLMAGLVTTLRSMWTGDRLGWQAWVLAATLALISLLSVLVGFNLNGWRFMMEKRVTKAIIGWLSKAC